MKFGLRILTAADDDVDEIAAYIAQDNTEQAVLFLDALSATYKMILDHPGRWPFYGFTHPRLRDIRERSVANFANYLIFYRIDAEAVEIVRVLHGARDLPSIFAGMKPPD